MKNINEHVGDIVGHRPEKILQFGEGNFLRAFIDWMIDTANRDGIYDGSVVVAQPIRNGLCEILNEQQGLYTVVIRDVIEGEMREEVSINNCISRCINPYIDYDALLAVARSEELEVIISNTTEDGIVYCEQDRLDDKPPSSYPGKLTALLYERYCTFNGNVDKGLLIIPCELIIDNGEELKKLVVRYARQWHLGEEFIKWFLTANKVVSTLVDRIVTGYPKNEIEYFDKLLGYGDKMLNTCEDYNLLAIQGPAEWGEILPIHKTRANVIWADDITAFRERKLRILNGVQNGTAIIAYLAGHHFVIDFMRDTLFLDFVTKLINNEILSNFTEDIPVAEEFAREVVKRLANPYIKHNLLKMGMHGTSKFRLRCLPSLLDYQARTGQVPPLLAFSLASLIVFFKGKENPQGYIGTRFDGEEYEIDDNENVIRFFAEQWKNGSAESVTSAVLANGELWEGVDLTKIPGLEKLVAQGVDEIVRGNTRAAMRRLLAE